MLNGKTCHELSYPPVQRGSYENGENCWIDRYTKVKDSPMVDFLHVNSNFFVFGSPEWRSEPGF